MMKLRDARVGIKSILFLGLTLAVSCSSQKKKSANVGDEDYPTDSVNEQGLVLNGDSDSGRAGGVRTVYFSYDQSSLSQAAKDVLAQNAEYLKANTKIEVQIEGHADERGGVQYNLALGQKRAQVVKNYLAALGVSSFRMSVVSYGKERPLEFGHDEAAWSKNRRANFVVTAK